MENKRHVYIVGSMRRFHDSPGSLCQGSAVWDAARELRAAGHDVFDDWHASGPDADQHWRDYEVARGHDYFEALAGDAARHNLHFDHSHLVKADTVVLVLPAGKSAHLEFGLAMGLGKQTHILFGHGQPGPSDRWDLMYGLSLGNSFLWNHIEDLIAQLEKPL
jgi:hypothetical protein